MISLISGIIVTGASAGGFWYAMPRNGEVHWTANAPVLSAMIPVGIVSAFSLGLALMAAGIFG